MSASEISIAQKSLRPPAIILVETQMSQNIGAVARAMLNFGATDLRLVAPLADWRSKDAYALAAGASSVLEAARRYDTLEDALSDLDYTFATTARHRDLVKDVFTPLQMMEKVAPFDAQTAIGFVFGREKSGLENEHLSLCDALVTFPINTEFPSLNIAQSVGIMAYQWHASQEHRKNALPNRPLGRTEFAVKKSMYNLFDHLESELDASGFLRVPHKRPLMVQNIRALLSRCEMTEQEVQTMHGLISFLAKMPPENRVRRSHREKHSDTLDNHQESTDAVSDAGDKID